ncbi:fructose-specific PTS transporter subunit EIIC [Enorma phocaeensis]|uniref:fructose-specific PTS transporter subunit EIIC n=1 Tax=Enorma phocaeensis TaxID=1871019 RepID=UPI0019586C5A|nr:PTS fructose transporter subunit IIC [Enorma phocaeensis]
MNAKQLGKDIMRHFSTGVSYMVPVVVAGGIITSVATIIGGQGVWTETETFWGVMRMIGQTGLNFVVPMISAYVAYSIADRPGLAPGFITGLIAFTMGTGFLGGMVTGLCSGYLAKALKGINLPARVQSLKVMFIIPIVTTLCIGLLLWYVVGTPIAWLTTSLDAWLNSLQGAAAGAMGAILGAMMAFDMGGPVNKIANTFGNAAFVEGAYQSSTLVLMAISIPPTIVFLATLLDRKKKLYSDAERETSVTAMIMGLCGITEGTIPFALGDPLRVIPSIVVGTSLSCALAGIFGIVYPVLLTTYMAIPFANNIPVYLVCVAVGSLVGALMLNALRTLKLKKQEAAEATE